MHNEIDLQHPRIKKAKIAAALGKSSFKLIAWTVMFISIALAVSLAYVDDQFKWLALTPAVISLMLLVWYKGELRELGEKTVGNSLVDKLDLKILENLENNNPSASDIFTAVVNTEDGYFFRLRYQLPAEIFHTLSTMPGSAANIWPLAEQLSKTYGTNGYTGGVVMVSLLKVMPDIEQQLSRFKLDIVDIENGIRWQEDIKRKRKIALSVKQFGGIARDFAYGYTPTLRYLGHNITEEIEHTGFYADSEFNNSIVRTMLQNISGGSGSVTLIGDVGVGKTTCVYGFADRLIEDKDLPATIKNHQVVALDAPTILSQARNRGELEGMMIRILNEAQRAKNIVLFFDDAEVFFGQGESSIDLSNILLPALDNSSVRMIFAMTPREWQALSGHSTNVASKFHTIQVPGADEEHTLHVLRDQIIFVESQKKVLYTAQALKESYRLGSRYIDSQAMPGAAISLLKSAAPAAENGLVTAEVVKKTIESSTGVKIQTANQDEATSLLSLEDEIHKYVINQTQAVKVIADALRRARSGVGNPERPVGTFLFLGPTGVGKTELSKALARVYFGDVRSLVRVDMNQYVNPGDVERLIAANSGEHLSFLGEVRRKPFSVILLDEIEKANRSVVNLLLQMLDEGVMRDSNNKDVSFKDAIIIATSNAGADQIRALINQGEDIVKLQNSLVDLIIERGIFAPELINRFDEVVVFRPLSITELIKVIELIVQGINRTLSDRKIQVSVSEEGKKWLVQKGYDAKLGARPMRRVAQKYIENILAKKLLSQTTNPGDSIYLDVADFENLP